MINRSPFLRLPLEIVLTIAALLPFPDYLNLANITTEFRDVLEAEKYGAILKNPNAQQQKWDIQIISQLLLHILCGNRMGRWYETKLQALGASLEYVPHTLQLHRALLDDNDSVYRFLEYGATFDQASESSIKDIFLHHQRWKDDLKLVIGDTADSHQAYHYETTLDELFTECAYNYSPESFNKWDRIMHLLRKGRRHRYTSRAMIDLFVHAFKRNYARTMRNLDDYIPYSRIILQNEVSHTEESPDPYGEKDPIDLEQRFRQLGPIDEKIKSLSQLATAIRKGRLPQVKRLIRQGLPLNTVDSNGDTILHTAIRCWTSSSTREEIVEFLLGLSYEWPDLNARDSIGLRPIDIAAKSDCLSAFQLLFEKMAKAGLQPRGIHWTQRYKVKSKVREFITNTYVLPRRGDRVVTPLRNVDESIYHATEHGPSEILNYLLSQSKNYGEASLLYAIYLRDVKIVRYLLDEGGVDLQLRNSKGQTPLHLAAGQGDLELTKCLLSYGAIPEARDRNGETPLRSAQECYGVDLDILRCLVLEEEKNREKRRAIAKAKRKAKEHNETGRATKMESRKRRR